jgi:hypothetical protein
MGVVLFLLLYLIEKARFLNRNRIFLLECPRWSIWPSGARGPPTLQMQFHEYYPTLCLFRKLVIRLNGDEAQAVIQAVSGDLPKTTSRRMRV